MSKKFTNKDQYYNREVSRYDKPIPSREHILSYLEHAPSPQVKEKIISALKIKGAEQKTALQKRLTAMVRDGQLMLNRKQQYALVENLPLFRAKVCLKKNGFAVLEFLDTKHAHPIYLHPMAMREVMHGDTVLVRIGSAEENGKKLAVLVEVVERGTEHLVGAIQGDEFGTFLQPIQKVVQGSIVVHSAKVPCKAGDYVQATILAYPARRKPMIVRVDKILGDHNMAGFERNIAIHAFNLPHTFSTETKKYCADLEQPSRREKDRLDWRKYPLVTIDGEDARDYDDAVMAVKQDNGWLLRVAIADVSHYVHDNSALDNDAQERATSVYLPGSVIPMLPEKLSNDLCSLRPEVERLALAVEMQISASGRIKAYTFSKVMIRSHARLTYTKVAMMLNKGAEVPSWFATPLKDLHDCYIALSKQRDKRGSIDFDLPETKVQFDKQGKISAIVKAERNIAHRLIEECMLVANEACADMLLKAKGPGIYRVHKAPSTEKLAILREFLVGNQTDFTLPNEENITPKNLQKLLKHVATKDHSQAIQSLVLSSMSQALYDTHNVGHFGLAYKHYTHFTSPIRRYPDLIVHRLVKDIIAKKAHTGMYVENLSALAKHSSMAERRADDASRYVINWLKCQFMQDKLGNTYWGTISAVKGFGVFVTLDDLHIDGLLHITQLDSDYYDYDASTMQLIGRRNNKKFSLGQRIRVKVAKIDTHEHLIDFHKA